LQEVINLREMVGYDTTLQIFVDFAAMAENWLEGL
jgi:hypothetical protein